MEVRVAHDDRPPRRAAEQVSFDVVIPTLGRSTLRTLLLDLARAEGPAPERILLIDDRPAKRAPLLSAPLPPGLGELVRVLPGPARGPAAARNLGWRAGSAPWVAFLDDDVRPGASWFADLVRDLRGLADEVAGCQGRIRVPLPKHRAATDWERNVAGLEGARWATADMAYRRRALEAVGGFDERFPRAYREDADLGLRVTGAGHSIVVGERVVDHPVRDADPWVSVRLQRNNADDAMMRALHGPRWRERAACPRGARGAHLFTTAAAGGALAGLVVGSLPLTLGLAGVWGLCTARFAWRRIAPGPRTVGEVTSMLATSVVVPVAATWHFLRGVARTWTSDTAPLGPTMSSTLLPIRAVLVDRDGTLIEDVPYNGDPARVVPRPTAKAALDRLRAAGLPLVVVTNQSGIGRGRLTVEQVEAVNQRVEALLGPFDGWFVCPHAPEERCPCRKPRPGMVLAAARALEVAPTECVLIGDIEADVKAARAAGAWGVLVPTQVTRPREVWSASDVAADLAAAADRVVLRATS